LYGYLNENQLGAERFRATEILFSPEIIGTEYQGVHEMLFDSINRTDLDLRQNLFGTIVLSGGTTLSKGISLYSIFLQQALAKELKTN
jgi:centractin